MDPALIKKLQLKPGQRVLVLNAPQGYLDRFLPLPDGAALVEEGQADWVLAFLRSRADVETLAAQAIAAVKREGLLWLAYPKRGPKVTDINRDKGWETVYAAGWGPVAQVALDEAWSALRFRPEADIQRKSGGPWQR